MERELAELRKQVAAQNNGMNPPSTPIQPTAVANEAAAGLLDLRDGRARLADQRCTMATEKGENQMGVQTTKYAPSAAAPSLKLHKTDQRTRRDGADTRLRLLRPHSTLGPCR